MNCLNLVRKVIVITLIAAQLLLILSDFPSENNQSQTAFTVKAAKVKFVIAESEALDGEEDMSDFCPQNLLSNNLNSSLFSRNFTPGEAHPFRNQQHFYERNLYLNNCALLI